MLEVRASFKIQNFFPCSGRQSTDLNNVIRKILKLLHSHLSCNTFPHRKLLCSTKEKSDTFHQFEILQRFFYNELNQCVSKMRAKLDSLGGRISTAQYCQLKGKNVQNSILFAIFGSFAQTKLHDNVNIISPFLSSIYYRQLKQNKTHIVPKLCSQRQTNCSNSILYVQS